MASAVVSDNFETGTGGVPQLGGTGATTCKAWVNFNGTGTVAIRDSYNVASITDNGTGDFSINFTTAMPNANYSATTDCRLQAGAHHSVAGVRDITASSCRITVIHNTSSVVQDKDIHTTSVFSN